ncbi:Xaa-Pro dipeptidase [Psychrosphaera sp. 1_MG-2023]|uniref:Xaa-Pro dipeptidase n=1 Tax=Psychrosphaera sp. 1_MG-2023 TaxID=3062643 RepID=UPI0026E3C067|nr:Xaa-Pro dipeptidase [Psychrosphaera sp. 1_MG-2023]MDO6720946.1 Xaa-Pro dipeptidase [Psychrosphaera sp. 1_MG-2023]
MSLTNLLIEHVQSYKQCFDELQSSAGFEHLILFGGTTEYPYKDDIPYSFKASSEFNLLCPILNIPDCWIVNTIGKKPKLLLFLQSDIWTSKQQLPSEDWLNQFDVIEMYQREMAKQFFPNTGRVAFVGPQADFFCHWPLGERNPSRLINSIDWQRANKTQYEQECIRQANHTSVDGHVAAEQAFNSGASEFEINLAFCRGCQQSQFELAYPSVIATNAHAAILHYGEFERQVTPGNRSLLIDAGATHHAYKADISRTYAAKNKVPSDAKQLSIEPFSELITALDVTQQSIVDEVAHHANFESLNLSAFTQVATLLVDFGVIKSSVESVLANGLLRYFMPHSIGHFIGLQVHDVGGRFANSQGQIYISESNENIKMGRAITNDQVFTIEPGVYFIDSLLSSLFAGQHKHDIDWRLVNALKPFGGVRIEDNILVGSSGVENFTRQAFSQHATNQLQDVLL